MNNRGGEGARLGLPDIDDGFLFRLCEAAAANGGMVCPHPETIEIAWVLRDRLKNTGSGGQRRSRDLERHAPALRRGRRGAARSVYCGYGRRAALRRPHVVGRGARGCAAPSPRRRDGTYRNLSALSHARHRLVGRGHRQNQSAAARSVRSRSAVAGAAAPATLIRSRPITFTAISRQRKAASGRRRPVARGLKHCCRSC